MSALPKSTFPWRRANAAHGFTEGSDDPATARPSCGGRGVAFSCPEHAATLGECCPAGTQRIGCPGKTIACAACLGTGRA